MVERKSRNGFRKNFKQAIFKGILKTKHAAVQLASGRHSKFFVGGKAGGRLPNILWRHSIALAIKKPFCYRLGCCSTYGEL